MFESARGYVAAGRAVESECRGECDLATRDRVVSRVLQREGSRLLRARRSRVVA